MPNLNELTHQRDFSSISNPSKNGKWSQDQRLEFIDFRLCWEGKINRSDLCEFFNISVPQASLDITRYKELFPDNVKYDPALKVYQKTDLFHAKYSSSQPSQFLNDLLAIADKVIPENSSFIGWYPPFDTVPNPYRQLSSDVLFMLLQAIREKKSLEIEYQSISKQEPGSRTISPHTLAYDGFRFHIRAYCHTRKDYRDFVIARIQKCSFSNQVMRLPHNDTEWKNIINLVIVPNPKLSEAQQKIIAYDYGMENGTAEMQCRQSLLWYALQRLGLRDVENKISTSQHIVLKNRKEIEPYISNRVEI